MSKAYSRHIKLERVLNFRDIGGYRTGDGRTVAWRRVFRSGTLIRITPADATCLTEEIGLNFILDLRSGLEIQKGICPLSETGVKYHNLPLMTDGGNREEEERLFGQMTSMGEFYLYLLETPDFGQKIVVALEVIAGPDKHPLVFHCSAGKDRTGILTAILLSVLGVADKDIIEDYTLSNLYMEELTKRFRKDPEMAKLTGHLPSYFWEATAESMELFLDTLKHDYGSVTQYLCTQGMEPALAENLKKALLV
jgi:protein-tyrosine phosphatase